MAGAASLHQDAWEAQFPELAGAGPRAVDQTEAVYEPVVVPLPELPAVAITASSRGSIDSAIIVTSRSRIP